MAARGIPLNQAAVLLNTEANTVLALGTFEHLTSVAREMNKSYQTVAYAATLIYDGSN